MGRRERVGDPEARRPADVDFHHCRRASRAWTARLAVAASGRMPWERPDRMHSFNISPVDASLDAALQRKIDSKTKPLGALGSLESLTLQLGRVQRTLTPRVAQPHLFVFAGDHGAAKSGVSAYPQDVTWQMVENFLAGGAAINVFARQLGWGLSIVDAGVAHDFGPRAGLIDRKIAPGTANYVDAPAMSADECTQAIAHGAALVRERLATGCTVIACGEMGIGNTASASLLTHCLTGTPLDLCIGRGTGLDDEGLARKKALLAKATARYQGQRDPLPVLAEFGGFEIAMMTGAMLAAAEGGALIVVDGFIVTAALLVAAKLEPAILDYCAFAHRSGEPGHRLQLETLRGRPLLDLDLRLGEGTGAALALPLIQAAVAFLAEMASFETAGVADKL
jgi:nicotinate-nucleotide--dimethylbenzimidazole phosphoribosyltransferase